jgi:putative transposase
VRYLAALPGPLHEERAGACRQKRPPRRLGLHRNRAFAQETAEAASVQWRAVADQIRPKVPKLATIMDEAENDVLAYMTFPKEHRVKLHSINPIERLNGEIKRRTEVVGIFPNDDAIVRLVGALLLEQNDEWAVQRARYMTLETISQMSDDPLISLPAVAR